jgi:dCMP deaminase
MRSAREVSRRSKCASRQIGAVLVRDGCVVAEGYNGAPRGVDLCQDPNATCPRKLAGYKSGEGLESCPAVHAEQNAVAQAARLGAGIKGATLYAYCCRPCKWCAGLLINAGVRRIVHLNDPAYDELAGVLLEGADIQVCMVSREEVETP